MRVAVVGGGPAGLRAAEVAAAGGAVVSLWDRKPSVGRKFLVAGRGGLNLTKDEPLEVFARHYLSTGHNHEFWHALVREFGPEDTRSWALGLGVETFVASTRRVYPKEMRAAPLLRRWVERLPKSEWPFTCGMSCAEYRGTPSWALSFQGAIPHRFILALTL
jgi:predicted flavoprotein YhiN